MFCYGNENGLIKMINESSKNKNNVFADMIMHNLIIKLYLVLKLSLEKYFDTAFKILPNKHK